MMTLDLNDAGPQRSFDLIPAGTIATVQMAIRPGGAGEDGWLKKTNDGGAEMADCEFTVVDGEYAKRKIWQLLLLSGSTDGHASASEISRAFLRGVVESARNIKPSDASVMAYAKRKVSFADLNGMRFIARVFVEKSKDSAYPDKNRLEALTPDHKAWRAIEQLPPGTVVTPTPGEAPAAKPVQAITRPEWAQG